MTLKWLSKFSVYAACGFAALYLQATLAFYLPSGMHLAPNLLLVTVVYLALEKGTVEGAVASFLYGAILDLACGPVIGPWAGAFVVVYGACAAISQGVFVQSPMTALTFLFGSSILGSTCHHLFGYATVSPLDRSFVDTVTEAFTTSAVSPLVFPVLAKLFSRRGRGRRSSRMAHVRA